MIRKVFSATLASALLVCGAAQATETIVWWDFLSGGDGVRMKAHARRVQQGARRQGRDRRDDARMGRAVLQQGADLGRRSARAPTS